jgi:hypothetical protein
MKGRTMQPLPPDDDLFREQEAEWRALPLMRYIRFTKVLEALHIATKIVIQGPKGKEITIQASDVYDRGTWKKFLESIDQMMEPYQLTGMGETLPIQYKRWFLTQHTRRYQFITAEADLAWFEKVVTLAVKRFIMENKFEAYLREQPGAFASTEVALVMTIVMVLHDMQKEMPSVTHHIAKEPELLKALMREYFDGLERALKAGGWPLIYELLPQLPRGMIETSDWNVGKQEHQGEEARQEEEEG